MSRFRRRGSIATFLLVFVAATFVGLLLAWLRYKVTFDGVHENLMVYQSKKVVQVYVDEDERSDYLTPKVLTDFPLAEVVNGKAFDFGVAEPGKLLKHVFKVKNSGNQDLELMLEGVTCKCLTLGLGENEVQIVKPGETFDIALEWRSDSLTKNFQQFARIKTNDPNLDRAKIELKVSGRIVSPVLGSPERVSCFLKSSATDKDFEFVVHAFESPSIDPASFGLKSVECTNTLISDHLEFKWDKLSQEEIDDEVGCVSGYRVTGTVKAGAPTGFYVGNLKVETTSGHPISLEFGVDISSPVKIRPINQTGGANYYPETKIIDFGIVSPGANPSINMMMLYNIDEPDLKVELPEPATTPAGYVDAEILRQQKTSNGVMVQLKVSIPKDCPKAQYNGPTKEKMLLLRVRSNSDFAKELVFFVSFAKN